MDYRLRIVCRWRLYRGLSRIAVEPTDRCCFLVETVVNAVRCRYGNAHGSAELPKLLGQTSSRGSSVLVITIIRSREGELEP